MRGRLTATAENRRAARHIEDGFRRFGLSPAAPGASYRQPVELLTASLGEPNALRLHLGTEVETAASPRDFFPTPFSGSGQAAGPVVFAGFGIAAADLGRDDYRDADVSGKVVLVLDHEPGEFDPESPFAGVVASERGRALRKVLAAQRRGAVAVAIVDDVHNHARRWSLPDLAIRAWPRRPPRIPPLPARGLGAPGAHTGGADLGGAGAPPAFPRRLHAARAGAAGRDTGRRGGRGAPGRQAGGRDGGAARRDGGRQRRRPDRGRRSEPAARVADHLRALRPRGSERRGHLQRSGRRRLRGGRPAGDCRGVRAGPRGGARDRDARSCSRRGTRRSRGCWAPGPTPSSRSRRSATLSRCSTWT